MTEITKPSDINKIWATGGVKTSPTDTKISTGWIVEEPPREFFNWLDGKQDQAIAHNNQHGINVWDSSTNYLGAKSFVQGSNGQIYVSLADSVGVDPTTDVSEVSWHKVIDRSGTIASNTVSSYIKTLLNNSK